MNENNGIIRHGAKIVYAFAENVNLRITAHVRYVRCNHSRTDFSKQLLW